MLEYVVIIGLIIGAGFYIISPLLKPDQFNGSSATGADEMLTELNLKKEGAYATIRELEFDLNMGKLSKEDYEILKAQYVRDAIDCIKAIDELQMNKNRQTGLSVKDLENEIEREISTLRASVPPTAAEVFCTQCGQRTSSEDRFCSKCGAKLTKL
jgi:hypothetical protein